MSKINNCPFCSSAVEPGSEFCKNCGASLSSSNEPSSNVTILGSSDYPQPQQQDYYQPPQPQQAHPPQQYSQPVYYQTPTSTVYVPQQREDSLAQVSLIMAILGCTGILPIIGSLVAIITGHISRSRSKGQTALIGLILGYIALGLTIVVVLIVFMPIWLWY